MYPLSSACVIVLVFALAISCGMTPYDLSFCALCWFEFFVEPVSVDVRRLQCTYALCAFFALSDQLKGLGGRGRCTFLVCCSDRLDCHQFLEHHTQFRKRPQSLRL